MGAEPKRCGLRCCWKGDIPAKEHAISAETLFNRLTARNARDAAEARNGLRHVASLSMTKIADGLIDPKLVLSSLTTGLGAPAWIVALLVPVREAGALIPQIALAGWVRGMRHRKWAWIAGSLGQGIAAALIVLAALNLEALNAGVAILAALALLAVARACSSVSYKDILGKTIAKTRRGTVTGLAGSASSVAVILFALLLLSGWAGRAELSTGVLTAAIALAAVLWMAAAGLFSTLEEDPSQSEEGAQIDLSPLKDAQFRRFVAVRGCLTTTALAPPFLVMLAGAEGDMLRQLGALVLASAAAAFVSSYVWGRLADRSSRKVLILSGGIGAAVMAFGALAGALGWTQIAWVSPAVLFVLMLAYQGVRQGRSTYLVDMAPESARSSYAALANTFIGGALLLTGALGGALSFIGPVAALFGFALLAALGGLLALSLQEVETEG